jgi:CBS domain-containing protein
VTLQDITVADASVPVTATFTEAAKVLAESSVPAIAVVDPDGRVAGLFASVDLLRGLFPAYLEEMRHTTFVLDDEEVLTSRAKQIAERPVTELARDVDGLLLEADASLMHIAERFLHCDEGALPVVDADDRFVGMLGRAEFALAMLRRRLES